MSINVNHKFCTWLKQPRLSRSLRRCSTEIQRIMSGNDFWNNNVLSWRRKVDRDVADWTSSGREFHIKAAATGNERRPTVDRTTSWCVNDDRRRWRPGRSDARTSWFRYDGAIPFNTRYAMSASLKLTRSGRRSQCSILRGRWSRGRSDGVGTPNDLKASLEVDRKPDEYEVAIVEPGVDERTTKEQKQSLVTYRRRRVSCHNAVKHRDTVLQTWVAAPRSLQQQNTRVNP